MGRALSLASRPAYQLRNFARLMLALSISIDVALAAWWFA